jgi:methionyl-tRNA formyltransferase
VEARPTSVVVLGKGTLAIRVADWFLGNDDYELRRIVPVVPEPQWTDSFIEWADEHSVPSAESGNFADCADGPVADLGISIFYDKILPAEFIDRFGRLLNLHNGPLPRYRGVSPVNWALKNGERSHGVTIHEITPGIDDGPIVAQVEYSIYPAIDEVEDVYARALEFGWTLFEQTLPILHRIKACEQDHSQATYYSAAENHLLDDRSRFTRALSLKS